MHSKEAMLMMLAHRKAEQGYKKKKLETTTRQSSPDADVQLIEMDCEPSEGNYLIKNFK